MSLEKNIFYSQISLYNLAIFLNIIDIIFGSVLLSLQKNACYSYFANTIYTIVISIILTIGLIVIIYFMAKYKEFNKYIFICNLILFGIFAINFVYETIVLSNNCYNKYYK